MRYPPTPPWCLMLPALFAIVPILRAEKLVLASSSASRDYVAKRTVDGVLQRQTYVFMPGRYLTGNTRDKSLERVSFRVIAERLAVSLEEQHFYPAPSLGKADLLLVVHWGATAARNQDSVAISQGFETLASLRSETEAESAALEEAVAAGDMLMASQARSNLVSLANQTKLEENALMESQRDPNGADTAALLGLSSDLAKDDESLAAYERRKTLWQTTREESYFVVVMAYDAPTLVSTKKLKRLWTLRVSINTAGVNFSEALDRISTVAAQYFGTQQEKVSFDYPRPRERTGTVKLDEIVVLGTDEPKKP